ncbi:alpha/beta fold hydrolase [Microbacterium sp. SD291]|uniref:alpha/beta fold hydrolase n=1 Tax=Microbacterium sp. SD291 TaxID=2782007 RepID=UPI001A967944|nr:alpha/beta hydrolase [Microbacterium sp. SD291]MBO0980394.1 alpha/beta hydrolase [Microbacterium sp. SD291]
MSEVVVDGLRIAYRRRGSGPPLLLLHGAFEDSRIWTADMERLAGDLDVIAWDAPGCGLSDDVPDGWGDSDWAAAAAGFIDALGLTRPAVAGFSLGSVLALLLAREHPASVGRLVLVGAYAGWGGSLGPHDLAERVAAARFTMEHPVQEWADGFLDSVFAPGTAPERRALARGLLDDWRPRTTDALLRVMVQDLRPGLPRVESPTAVVRGAEDARSPRSASLELRALLPHAVLREIAGAGHDCTGPEPDALLVAVARDAAAAADARPVGWHPPGVREERR